MATNGDEAGETAEPLPLPTTTTAAALTSPAMSTTSTTMPTSTTPTTTTTTTTTVPGKKDGTRDVEQSLEVLDRVLSEYDERDTPLSSMEHSGNNGGCAIPDVVARDVTADQGDEIDAASSAVGTNTNSSTTSTSSSNSSSSGTGSTSETSNSDGLSTTALSTAAPRQNEDDGYVSMNGRRCFTCTADYRSGGDRRSTTSDAGREDGEPNTSSTTGQTTQCQHQTDTSPSTEQQQQQQQQQVTLPKATVHRTTDMITRFASLPSGSAAASTLSMDQPAGASKQPRAILGIDISAVHSAVLSGGVTRIPETIVNEHPVTIYPGRGSPTKRNSNSASPRNPQCGSGGPASPRAALYTSAGNAEPNDNTTVMSDAQFESAAFVVGRNSPSVVQQEQKLSKLFASAMRTEELASNAVAAHGELITLKSVFNNAHRLNNNMAADGSAATANCRTYIGLIDDEMTADIADPIIGPENGEEFSDDSLEEEPVTAEQSELSLSMESSVASLGGAGGGAGAGMQLQPQPQRHSNQLRQVVDVHVVPNGADDADGPYGNDDNAKDNGPWVLREDVVQRRTAAAAASFLVRKSHLIEPLDYNFSPVNNAQPPAQRHHQQHSHLQHHHDEIEAYGGSDTNTDDDEWPQPPPANISMQSDHYDDDDVDNVEDEYANEDDDVDEYDVNGAAATSVVFNHRDDADARATSTTTTTTDDDDSYAVAVVGAAEVKINDTYVIRKGGKQRASVLHQFSPDDDFAGASNASVAIAATGNASSSSSSVNNTVISTVAVGTAAEQLCTTNAKFVSSIRVPFTRHSIDLGGAGAAGGGPDAKHAARTRLSLDLGSPNRALPPPPSSAKQQQPSPTSATSVHHAAPATYPYAPQQQHATAANGNNNNNAKAVLSPRYSEFKKYKSTFDAFYALDVTNSNHQQKQQQQHQQQHQQQQHVPHQYHPYHNNNAAAMRSIDALHEDHIPHQYNQQHYGTQPQSVTDAGCGASALMRVSSLPTISPAISGEKIATPRRELAPPLEEDEEQDSERDVPLRQIENNISALLRGDIAVARIPEGNNNPVVAGRRPSIGLRSGVHKSESAKEMLLSQNMFGPLPPSPTASISSQEQQESYGFPPLPPLPPSPDRDHRHLHHLQHQPQPVHHNPTATPAYTEIGGPTNVGTFSSSRSYAANKSSMRRDSAAAGGGVDRPPSIPPHRGPSINTLKTRSMDAGISRSHRANSASSHQLLSSSTSSPQCPPKSNSYDKHRSPQPPPPMPPLTGSTNTRRRMMPNGFPKRIVQSPRDEHRLQTSLSLPETPIFARGSDIPRTPHRRAAAQPAEQYAPGGSRTAPRQQQTSCLNSSVMGIGNTLDGRHKLLGHQAFAGGEMLRLAGGPARGWYPRQRQQQQEQHQQHHHQQQQRPLSTENLEGLSTHSRSARFWDGETPGGARKPLTLPPNMSPKFFNKSPRDAIRRVTSLLIRKGATDSKKDREASIKRNFQLAPTDEVSSNAQPKKKGFFKSFWKKSKHISLDK